MKKRNLPYAIIISYLFLSYAVAFLMAPSKVISLAREDGFFESIGAVFFLIAALIFFITFLMDREGNDFHFLKTKRNLFFLLLAILFFIAFGEEISWGQRIFHLQTPAFLKTMNVQNEINIHNLSFLTGDVQPGVRKSGWALMLSVERLFSLFWFAYCFVIPILDKISIHVAKRFKIINLPIASIGMGVIFVLNYLLSKIAELYASAPVKEPVVEIKESNFAFLFLMLSIWFLRKYGKIWKKLPIHSLTTTR